MPIVVDHPLVQHKFTKLRDKNTTVPIFREMIEEISQLLAYEVTRDLKVNDIDVETPMAKTKGKHVEDDVVLVSILRAGNAMLWGMMKLLPFAPVGHIGIYRDKFVKNTVEYYFRLPDNIEGKKVILLDPMLATGDTSVAAISRLKEYGVSQIRFVTLVASKEGIAKIEKFHPETEIYTLSVEPELDKDGYIVPGIGDAGDRIFGTMDI